MTSTVRTPLVSVCVPTYDGAEHLGACLDGVLGQELDDLEVLVGDDLSKDDTLEIARSRRDPRVRILPFRTRAGMSANWSRCIAEARGKYVALVAQDDLVAPQWAGRLAGLLESHPEADLAFGHRTLGITDERSRDAVGAFFEASYPAMLERFYARAGVVISPEAMLEAALEHQFEINLIGEPSFTMVRRDHAATREGYHPEMRQLLDWEFASRFFVARPVLHCAENLGTYRIHSGGSTVGNSQLVLQARDYRNLLESVLRRFAGRLSADQAATLRERRMRRDDALIAHERELIAGMRTLEAEREHLLAHVRTLEAEREHLRGHVQNLERILGKIHGRQIYRVLCGIKDVFGKRAAE